MIKKDERGEAILIHLPTPVKKKLKLKAVNHNMPLKHYIQYLLTIKSKNNE